MIEENNEDQQKAEYANLLLKERDPFKAAILLFPANTNRALWVANHWPHDPVVKEFQKSLLSASDELDFLPTKAELARDIWEKMKGVTTSEGRQIAPSPDEYSKLAKLYADVRGFIEKPQNNQNITVVIPKAIEVPTHGTNAEWEAAAATQQRELLDVSRSRH